MNWYALQTHTSYEPRVAERLAAASLDCYWPSYEARTRHAGGRGKPQIRALFPGYVFAKCDVHEQRRIIVAIPHVIRIVGFGDHPVAIPEQEIESVRILADSPTVEPCPLPMTPGQLIFVRYGPLAGAYGIIERAKKGGFRVVVSVSFLGRAVSAEVDAESLEARLAA